MAYFTRAQTNPQFPNVPNPNFQFQDLGNTLDSVYNAYLQSRQMGLRESLVADERNQRANAETVQFGATLPTSPEQRLRAQAPLTQNQGPVQPGQAPLGQSGFDADPSVAALQRAMEQHRSSQRMGQQKEALGMVGKAAEIGKTQAETKKLEAEAGALPAQRGEKAETELRGELQTLSKPFTQVRDSMGRIEASAKNPTAAGDLALIFNYMKVLDPGSTVREGEFATAQNSASIPLRIQAQYNKVMSGERLAPEQREDFLNRARELYQSQLSIQKQQEEQYRGLANRRGARPENVILDQGLPVANDVITRTLKDGSTVRVRPIGGGKYAKVD